jgi:hypothetical protein
MARPLRALVQSMVMLVIALLLFFWLHHELFAKVVITLAGVVLISGLAVPPVFHAIERFGQWLGLIVARGLTWILLVPFFYLCFATGAFILKLRGKDPMCRECPSRKETYWVPRPPVTDMSHYRKQH